MTIYIAIVIGVALISIITRFNKNSSLINSENTTLSTNNTLGLLLVSMILIVPYGIRYSVGADFNGYYFEYTQGYYTNLQDVFVTRDWLFYLITAINYNISGGNWYFHSFMIGIITYIPLIIYYKKYAVNFTFAISIYIMSMSYFFPYNGIRQGLAITIVLIAFDFLSKKKFIKYFVMMFIASFIHSTAIFMIPFGVLCYLGSSSLKSYIIKFLLLFSFVFLGNSWDIIINIMELLGQDKIVADYGTISILDAHGSGNLRLLVYLVPVFLSMIYLYKRKKSYKAKIKWSQLEQKIPVNFYINCVEYAAIFMYASTKFWIFSRLALYFSVFTPLLLSYLIILFNDDSKKIYMFFTYFLFFIYMCLMLLHGEGNLLPFKTFFSN